MVPRRVVAKVKLRRSSYARLVRRHETRCNRHVKMFHVEQKCASPDPRNSDARSACLP